MSPAFTLEHTQPGPDGPILRLSGNVVMTLAPAISRALRDELVALTDRRDGRHDARRDVPHGSNPTALALDLSGVQRLDGAGAALVFGFRTRLAERGVQLELRGAGRDVAPILTLYDDANARSPLHEERPPPGALEHVGAVSWAFGTGIVGVLGFVGDVTAAVLAGLRHPRSIQWADLPRLMERTGADALPIVALIAFLIGLVTAFQASDTLARYGANVFLADMVGLSITRVMGPLMMAILVAGRSGAGIAAELGTMTVSEEIDALHVLGLDPLRFLVIPRVLALVTMVPLLTLLADLVGIVGGGLIGVAVLDLTPAAFVNRLHTALDLWDVASGLLLSLAYGVAIGMIATERGLATRGGAEGVGRYTTSAVVTILFHLVIITAVLTILFQSWGI